MTGRRLFPRATIAVGVAVLAWFALAEVGTYFWYASHEAGMPLNKLPASGREMMDNLRELVKANGEVATGKDVDEMAMDTLKASFGHTLSWREIEGPAAVTVLGWNLRNAVGGAETMHNPGKCLRAAGWQVGAHTDFGTEVICGTSCDVAQWEVSREDFRMLAFSAVIRRFADEPHKFKTSFRYENRMRSVVDGRRDAPVFIVLGYLPLASEADVPAVRARFQKILRAILCGSAAEAGKALRDDADENRSTLFTRN